MRFKAIIMVCVVLLLVIFGGAAFTPTKDLDGIILSLCAVGAWLVWPIAFPKK